MRAIILLLPARPPACKIAFTQDAPSSVVGENTLSRLAVAKQWTRINQTGIGGMRFHPRKLRGPRSKLSVFAVPRCRAPRRWIAVVLACSCSGVRRGRRVCVRSQSTHGAAARGSLHCERSCTNPGTRVKTHLDVCLRERAKHWNTVTTILYRTCFAVVPSRRSRDAVSPPKNNTDIEHLHTHNN